MIFSLGGKLLLLLVQVVVCHFRKLLSPAVNENCTYIVIKGIGLEFAKLACEKGANVIIADLKLSSEAKNWIDGVEEKKPASVRFQFCDVTCWKDLESLPQEAERYGIRFLMCGFQQQGFFEPVCSLVRR